MAARDGRVGGRTNEGIEGCPDDLTVWLCYVCHGCAHGLADDSAFPEGHLVLGFAPFLCSGAWWMGHYLDTSWRIG